MINFIKKLFGKSTVEETRMISTESVITAVYLNRFESLTLVASYLRRAINDGKLKEYAGVKEFLNNVASAPSEHDHVIESVNLESDEMLSKLKKLWITRSYKTSFEGLHDLIMDIRD